MHKFWTPAELRAAAGDTPREHFHDCTRCGQTVITREAVPMCATCRKADRAPQGESMRLFTPAPNPIPGQLSL